MRPLAEIRKDIETLRAPESGWHPTEGPRREAAFRLADDMARMFAPCDGCVIDEIECPGQPAHCARGQHCVATTASCASEWSGGENPAGHPNTCEDCGASLRPGLTP